MIEAFIKDFLSTGVKNKHILDIGCGNGQISQYFLHKGNTVSAVDVKDQRTSTDEHLNFKIVDSEKLPFDNHSFDIVISHHVIEHVEDQALHLSEMLRVLKNDGAIYIGCPNRSSPFMAGHVGNDKVLTLHQMHELFDQHKVNATDYYIKLLKEPNKFYCETKYAKYLPIPLLRLLRIWYPSQCFILTKKFGS